MKKKCCILLVRIGFCYTELSMDRFLTGYFSPDITAEGFSFTL
jgi:hypothetical protein